MGVSSYFEFIVTLFGWVLYDNLFQVLAGSGVIYLPFLIMLATHIVSSRKAGDDEGSAAIQSLKKIETDLVVMILVVMLCVIPSQDVRLGEMQYSQPSLDCQVTAKKIPGNKTNTTFDRTLQTLDGQTGRIPVWWAVMHIVSKSITSASIAGIPCSHNLAAVEGQLANDKIDDPTIRRELQEFIQDCYMPSKSKFLRDGGTLSEKQLDSTHWLGSRYFLTKPGFYDTYYSQAPRAGWAYVASRDAGFEADAEEGGHPNCVEWWQNSTIGLRHKVLGSLEDQLKNNLIYNAKNLMGSIFSSATDTEKENILLRKYLAIQTSGDAYEGVAGKFSTSYNVRSGDIIKATASGPLSGYLDGAVDATVAFVKDVAAGSAAAIGGVIALPKALAEGEMIREGVSIIHGIILMMFIILLPFLMLFGQFKPANILTLSIIFFALNFIPFLWGVAFYVDNHLMAALVEGQVFAPTSNPTQSLIVLWIQRFLYLFFPVIFLSAMSWVGIKVGVIGQEMANLQSKANEPGQVGGAVISDVAAKTATKGMGGKKS